MIGLSPVSLTRMYRLFDKHGTKFLAVFGSLLMLAFILPSNWAGRGNGTYRFGKLDGREIDPNAVRAMQDAFRSLNNVILTVQDQQGQPTQMPLPQALRNVFSAETLRQLQSNPLQWYLLVREAEDAGVLPNDSQIEDALSGKTMLHTDDGQLVPMKDINPTIRNGYREALRETLSVVGYFGRSLRTVKVSRSEVDDALAKASQQLRIRIVSFKTTDYESKIAPLTDDALTTQFKAYADVASGNPSPANPFGFGYRIPDRLQLQWVSIPNSEVTQSVESSKTPELWEEDAIIYYQKNQDSFKISTTQPTTRPFADAKADVLKKLQAPLIEQKRRAIANRITQQMQSDMKPASSSAVPTTQQTLEAKTHYGVPYGSFEYLQKLSDDIQKQYNVKLTLVNEATPMSREQLQASDALGLMMTEDYNAGIDALFSSLTTFNPQGTLALGQPSKVLLDMSGLTIARAIAAEQAHAPASLNDVRVAVEKDLKQQRAFELANDAAQKAADTAKSGSGLAKTGATPLTSDWFGQTTDKIAGLGDVSSYQPDLMTAAFNAIRGVGTVKDLPKFTTAKFERSGVAVAMELFDVKTTLNTAEEPTERLVAERQLQSEVIGPAMAEEWFSMDAIGRRIDFVPDASIKKSDQGPNAPGGPASPASPFIPG